jgi:hypothetical protein
MAEIFLLEPIFPGNTDFEMINYIFDFLGYTKEDNDVRNEIIKGTSTKI